MLSQRQETQRRRRALHDRLRALCGAPLMRGTVVDRVRSCGSPRCACATDPAARHPGQYVSVHLDGRTQTLHLRPADEADVRRAIATYHELWAIINDLTACELADLRRAARERRRGQARRDV